MHLICQKKWFWRLNKFQDSFWHRGHGNGPFTTANVILPVSAGFFAGIALIAQTTDNIFFPSDSGGKESPSHRNAVHLLIHPVSMKFTNTRRNKPILFTAHPPSSMTIFPTKYSLNSSDSCPSTSRCWTALSSNYKQKETGSIHTVASSFFIVFILMIVTGLPAQSQP